MQVRMEEEAVKILVTGGAGFIGSNLVRRLVKSTSHEVLNVDKLTYAGNLESLSTDQSGKNYLFKNVDISDHIQIKNIFFSFKPQIVMHLAAESHVDRSIDGPEGFVSTNIVGTYKLLEVAREYWDILSPVEKEKFRFIQVSTDEVFGDLDSSDDKFRETSAYRPNSPYSASKASADHLVHAWHRTYGFPAIITNCSNNYGPYQFPEKLIPKMITNAIDGTPLGIYGNGCQIRDWLYVEDHVDALIAVSLNARPGDVYCIGGQNQISNADVVKSICWLLEEMVPNKPSGLKKYVDLIEYVADRPGHDVKYAIDASKIQLELGWKPKENFETGLRKTVQWYLSNEKWWRRVLDKSYKLSGIGKNV